MGKAVTPWPVPAPHGFSGAFSLVVRPNPVLAPWEVHEARATRGKKEWPELTVLRWRRRVGGRGYRPPASVSGA